jgi:myo-inositol-1(or 4)-monophosphatase
MSFIDSVILANKEILELINSGDEKLKEKLNRGAGGDVSRVIDIKAEEIFIKYLSKFGKIISEECGKYGDGDDEIIIDPIDGSDNFVSNMPYFGSSVAKRVKGKITEAIIVNFANLDIFVKKGKTFKKAKLNKLTFSEVIINNYATIGVYERAYASKQFICRFNNENFKYRSPGAIALSLAYAHEFKFVIFKGTRREYDISAGMYMCSDLFIYIKDDFLVISKDKDIFSKLIKLIKG